MALADLFIPVLTRAVIALFFRPPSPIFYVFNDHISCHTHQYLIVNIHLYLIPYQPSELVQNQPCVPAPSTYNNFPYEPKFPLSFNLYSFINPPYISSQLSHKHPLTFTPYSTLLLNMNFLTKEPFQLLPISHLQTSFIKFVIQR